MTEQDQFGGVWTQQKLEALSKYLRAYTKIFRKNPYARRYTISYVDAFAGTGLLPVPEFGSLIPALAEDVEAYRKGSVPRALEIEPPFDKYVFIEKDEDKCKELANLAGKFPAKKIKILHDDANTALLRWCKELDASHERAVVFLDPFGASVDWNVISALGRTRAVDLWVLFPFFAVNRMLIRDRRPPEAWASRLTRVFGSTDWEKAFYSREIYKSLIDPARPIEVTFKTADEGKISEFFVKRLEGEFKAVAKPLPLRNSTGSLLFMFYFAAANKASALTGVKIANDIVGK